MSEIECIYRGLLHPVDTVKPDSEEFRSAQAASYDLSDRLEQSLSEEQKALWEGFLDSGSTVHELYALESYRTGVVFGVRLALEIFGE